LAAGGRAGPPYLPGRQYDPFLERGLAEEVPGPRHLVVEGGTERVSGAEQRVHVQLGVRAVIADAGRCARKPACCPGT